MSNLNPAQRHTFCAPPPFPKSLSARLLVSGKSCRMCWYAVWMLEILCAEREYFSSSSSRVYIRRTTCGPTSESMGKSDMYYACYTVWSVTLGPITFILKSLPLSLSLTHRETLSHTRIHTRRASIVREREEKRDTLFHTKGKVVFFFLPPARNIDWIFEGF